MYAVDQDLDDNEFPLLHCWEYLRDYDKWEDVGIFKKDSKKKKKRGRSPDDLPASSSDFAPEGEPCLSASKAVQ